MSKARRMRRWFRNLFRSNKAAKEIVEPGFVKAQLPLASFTRTGPGVRANLRSALKDLTPRQLQLARAKGWDKDVLTPEDLRIHTLQLAAVLQEEAEAKA